MSRMINLFITRLKVLIEQSGKSQKKICDDIGIRKQKMSNWKSGYTDPNIDDLIALANYFGVSVDYLIGYENEDGSKNTEMIKNAK